MTLLIISVILQLEQRRRVQKQELDSGGSHSGSADGLEDIRSQIADHRSKKVSRKGEMIYVDA